jgi:hypothetical protein
MTIRWFKAPLAVTITSVALVGCSGGSGPVEPDPSPATVEEQETPEASPERALEEGGADAALPPDQRTEND